MSSALQQAFVVFKFVSRSIRHKIMAVIVVAVVSAVLISSVTAAFRQASREFATRQNEIQAIAAAMATTIAAPVAAGNRRPIAATLNAVSRIPGLTYAAASDHSGRILFQHGTGIILRADHGATANKAITPFTAFNLTTYVAQTPIIHGGLKIGWLILIADLSPLRNALLESLLISLAFGAIAGAIGIGAATYLQRAITNPINTLTQTMREVRDTRDFDRIAVRQSNDETGQMVDAFNDMLSHIRQRDLALSRHRNQLESTVNERTRDLRAAKTAAERANAAKSDFLATMSHEIRTPMNGMLVMAELLSASKLNPRLQRYADVIVNSGNSLLTIINDILDFSKIEAGKLELESIAVDPRNLIDDTLQLFSERATSSGLEIAAYVSPSVPAQITADPVRLSQVLTNLVNNALKFTHTGGVLVSLDITDNTDPRNPTLSFAVRDTGIGIPEDKLATIFDAFAQADQSTTRQFGGTGIGLSICKRLVEAMDGELNVNSTVGDGSTFSFAASFEAVASARAQPSRSPTSTQTAVVALDDTITRDALVRSLEDWHFTIETDISAAMQGADIIFADATALPLEHGLEAPLIAIGRLDESQSSQLIDAGHADRIIELPIAVSELSNVLHSFAEDPSHGITAEVNTDDSMAKPAPSSFTGIHVLAADDSAVNREVLAEVLKRLDVRLTSVVDGQEAVEAARSNNFDLIFLDGSMPRLDGFGATREIRAWEAETGAAKTPIVALTAHVTGEQSDRWTKAGMSDYVTKPFTLQSIEACLSRWVAEIERTSESNSDSNASLTTIETISRDSALLDSQVLDTIREIQAPGDDLVSRVVGLYLEHAPIALGHLTTMDPSATPTEIADAAHALKSLSRNVGALRVGDIAGDVEDRARDSALKPTPSDLTALSDALDATLSALSALDELKTAA